MERIAAHIITFQGKDYHLSVLERMPDGQFKIYPLTEEIHSTRFISGHISVAISSDGKLTIEHK